MMNTKQFKKGRPPFHYLVASLMGCVITTIAGCIQLPTQPRSSVAVVSMKYKVAPTLKIDGGTHPSKLKISSSVDKLRADLAANAIKLQQTAKERLGPYWVPPSRFVHTRAFQELPQYVNATEDFVPDDHKATSLEYTNAAPDLCKEIDSDSVAQVEIKIEPILYRDPFQFTDSPDRLKIRITTEWVQFNRQGKKIGAYSRSVESQDFIAVSSTIESIPEPSLRPLIASALDRLVIDFQNFP